MENSKYTIECKCGNTFDCSNQMEVWKNELFEEIEKIIKKLR